MKQTGRRNLFITAGVILSLTIITACVPDGGGAGLIHGRVVDENGTPVESAIVRVKATDLETTTNAMGRFALSGIPYDFPVFITAWAAGYYINGVADVDPHASNIVEIVLTAHTDQDNRGYDWLPSIFREGYGNSQGCAECHSRQGTSLPFTLPVDEWLLDAHSQSAVNPHFLTMYAGTDLEGNQSPPTRYYIKRDYGPIPLPPDPNEPYYGPGFKLDFPTTAGNCAACHTPAAAIDNAYGINPTGLAGVEAEGIPCDFCHKVWDVKLDVSTGLPFSNMPGVLSFEFRRPPEGHQFFAGPFDDVSPGDDTYSPIQQQSRYCAPCHFGVFWNTQIYNSFGEWLESPYNAEKGKTCQDCHMPHTESVYCALPEKGGIERNPQTIFSHLMPGASNPDLLQNAVTMTLDADRAEDKLIVTASILNDQTGHHVPTDSPLRQMILLITATDQQGESLSLLEGPTIPDYGGVGDPAEGYYAGLPGIIYAKVLAELWTGITPTAAYWNPIRIISDNRLPAFGVDVTTFVFAMPAEGPVRIEARILFRRAFKQLMDQKGWNVPDIIMERQVMNIP